MQQRSALFDQTVANSHTVLVSADILSGGQVVATGLPVVGGSVTGNRRQFVRRTCTVVIGDPAYIPTGSPATVTTTVFRPGSGPAPFGVTPFGTGPFGGGLAPSWVQDVTTIPADLIAPYGNEIRLWRGAVTPAGPEMICVGTFGIRSVEFDAGGAFKGITVTGMDRCKRLAETRFPYPRNSIPQGLGIDQVRNLVGEVFPYVAFRVDPRLLDVTLPLVTWQENRDQAITDIVTSMGAELFCDPYGEFVFQPVPSPGDEPALTVTSGPGGVLVSARRSMTRDGVVNGVIARSATTNANAYLAVSDLIVDNDPTSPTYWGGKFGEVPGFYESSLLTSYDQANAAATALLLNQIGAARSLNYSTAVNPAVEPGDVGAVINPSTGEVEHHLHDEVTIPLDAKGVMTAQTRSTVSTPPVLTPRVYSGQLSAAGALS